MHHEDDGVILAVRGPALQEHRAHVSLLEPVGHLETAFDEPAHGARVREQVGHRPLLRAEREVVGLGAQAEPGQVVRVVGIQDGDDRLPAALEGAGGQVG